MEQRQEANLESTGSNSRRVSDPLGANNSNHRQRRPGRRNSIGVPNKNNLNLNSVLSNNFNHGEGKEADMKSQASDPLGANNSNHRRMRRRGSIGGNTMEQRQEANLESAGSNNRRASDSLGANNSNHRRMRRPGSIGGNTMEQRQEANLELAGPNNPRVSDPLGANNSSHRRMRRRGSIGGNTMEQRRPGRRNSIDAPNKNNLSLKSVLSNNSNHGEGKEPDMKSLDSDGSNNRRVSGDPLGANNSNHRRMRRRGSIGGGTMEQRHGANSKLSKKKEMIW